MNYRHLQTSYLMNGGILAGVVAIGAILLIVDDSSEVGNLLLLLGAVLLPVMAVFSRLRVSVDATSAVLAFGWGWPKRRIDLAGVVAVNRVRNRWYHGWGIHKLRRGWIYNVGGFDSVELELRSGKVLRIGTDEPAKLESILAERVSAG